MLNEISELDYIYSDEGIITEDSKIDRCRFLAGADSEFVCVHDVGIITQFAFYYSKLRKKRP